MSPTYPGYSAAGRSQPGTKSAPNSAPAIIDIEASGFGANSYPIEIGLALSDGSGYCSLIRPQNEWDHWDSAASRIHGISRETLATHGKVAATVAEELNRLLRGQTVYSDAWANDLSWVALLFEAADRLQGFRVESLRALMSDAQAACWDRVRAQVTHDLKLTRHRASSDARILQLTYLQTL